MCVCGVYSNADTFSPSHISHQHFLLLKKCSLVSYKASVHEQWNTVVVAWQFVGTCDYRLTTLDSTAECTDVVLKQKWLRSIKV